MMLSFHQDNNESETLLNSNFNRCPYNIASTMVCHSFKLYWLPPTTACTERIIQPVMIALHTANTNSKFFQLLFGHWLLLRDCPALPQHHLAQPCDHKASLALSPLLSHYQTLSTCGCQPTLNWYNTA